MPVFAIADLHLSFAFPKPMDIFGSHWAGHADRIARAWQELVSPDDTVLIVGDISWAMKLRDALPDLLWIDALPGRKIMVRGNHDYWWSSDKSAQKLQSLLPPSLLPLHKTSTVIQEGNERIGVAGTRGWTTPPAAEADAEILRNEARRLRLSLESLPLVDRKIAMIHIPPFGPESGNPLAPLLKEHEVEIVVYGHIHRGFGEFFEGEKEGILYYNVAVDQIDFTPKRIVE
ncbi:MAG: metallophosphoesterase [Armatimonadetes bacterium]|nr:metallophosphoesterase [Armatimonadota bacterium]